MPSPQMVAACASRGSPAHNTWPCASAVAVIFMVLCLFLPETNARRHRMRQLVAQMGQRRIHSVEHQPVLGARTRGPAPHAAPYRVSPALNLRLPRRGEVDDQLRQVPAREAGQHPMAEDRHGSS